MERVRRNNSSIYSQLKGTAFGDHVTMLLFDTIMLFATAIGDTVVGRP